MNRSNCLCLSVLLIFVFSSQLFAQDPQLLGFSGPYSTVPVRDDLMKGNRMISLDGLGGGSNSAYRKANFWSVSPMVGYMVAKRMAMGIRLSYGQDKWKEKVTSSLNVIPDQTARSLAPELFVRYYITPYRVKPYLQVSTGYNFQRQSKESVSGEMLARQSGNYVGAGAVGASVLLNKKIAMELQYNHRFFSRSEFDDANSKIKIRVGVSWFIR
jgi:outer membrane protein